MNENEGRYNNPKAADYNPRVDALIDSIPLFSDSVALVKAYRELNDIFMDAQPAVPVAHLPEEYYQFSTKVWTNWPTEKNPYAPPQLPMVAAGINTLWHLKLAESK
jgi:peptide/nickel transport system substrate-binding protein